MIESNDIKNFDKIGKGDLEAFKSLFDAYYEPLCNYTSRLMQNTYMSEDIVQEVFVKIWEEKAKIGILRSVKSYLYIAVKNKCLDKLKSEGKRLEHTRSFFESENKFADSLEIEHEEFRDYLSQCIEKLPPRCKDVFIHSRFKDKKQEKIAFEMDISLKTVKAQIGKALKLLRDCLNASYPEFL